MTLSLLWAAGVGNLHSKNEKVKQIYNLAITGEWEKMENSQLPFNARAVKGTQFTTMVQGQLGHSVKACLPRYARTMQSDHM